MNLPDAVNESRSTKSLGSKPSITICSCDAAMHYFLLRSLRTRTLNHAASGMNRVMWTINWPFLRPVVMIENKRLSPAQFTFSDQTLCTDKITQPFSTTDFRCRSLLDRVTADLCSTPYCYHPTGKPLTAFHDRPRRTHSNV